MSYVWILSVFVFFWKKDSPFVRFHAKQGLVLFIASLVFWGIPFIGQLLELAVLALCAMGFMAAAQGQMKDLPIVGPAARGSWSEMRASWRSIVHTVSRLWHKKDDSSPPTP